MLKLIVLIIIAILVLSFFGVSIKAIVALPATQENFHYVWLILMNAWNSLGAFLQGFFDSMVAFFNKGMSFHF